MKKLAFLALTAVGLWASWDLKGTSYDVNATITDSRGSIFTYTPIGGSGFYSEYTCNDNNATLILPSTLPFCPVTVPLKAGSGFFVNLRD